MPDRERWNERAAAAEYAVLDRFARRAPGLAWARATWPSRRGPAGVADGMRVWHYWWHAHLLDAAGDALRHRPSPGRRRRVARLGRTVAVRTAGRWVNPYYDDISWMGLALQRTGASPRGVARIATRLAGAVDPAVGALPWRVGSDLYNAPANGPAAILLARAGRRPVAESLADWIAAVLDDPATGLVRDGVEHGVVRDALYTYNQGVAIGAALALGEGDGDARHLARAAELVRAVGRWCAPDDGLLPSAGGGDGGLFSGIACRYLAEAAVRLRDDTSTADAAASARRLVLVNARALWDGRAVLHGRPLFAADPRRPAIVPLRPVRPRLAAGGATDGTDAPDGDLSVQLGAWLTLEAAASLPS
ncbi:glycoside hydrolase family 76 protein [Microbacterium sp. CJ88]|uniref:glycoside hydrolase family 76 protein n=1 Tax=Microbacterium sp. CJ88 TaxID=3445672 RepID=UPI003F659869